MQVPLDNDLSVSDMKVPSRDSIERELGFGLTTARRSSSAKWDHVLLIIVR